MIQPKNILKKLPFNKLKKCFDIRDKLLLKKQKNNWVLSEIIGSEKYHEKIDTIAKEIKEISTEENSWYVTKLFKKIF